MLTDSNKRIAYGKAWIKESANWLERHGRGPVRWDVWSIFDELVATDVPANELTDFLVARGWLTLW